MYTKDLFRHMDKQCGPRSFRRLQKCCLIITFANSLGQDQARKKTRPDLNPSWAVDTTKRVCGDVQGHTPCSNQNNYGRGMCKVVWNSPIMVLACLLFWPAWLAFFRIGDQITNLLRIIKQFEYLQLFTNFSKNTRAVQSLHWCRLWGCRWYKIVMPWFVYI